ncbi:MAG: glycosyltransferase family 2 protein [Muribaculaceae bacterium]
MSIDKVFTIEYFSDTVVLTDAIIFLFFAIAVLYLLIFAIKSQSKRHNVYPPSKLKYKYIVVFPAYKEDRVIINSVRSFFEQSYPCDKFDVLVISDRMTDATNAELERMGALVVKKDFENSTKTAALQEAVKYIKIHELKYDFLVVLDADNWVDEYFLDKMNDAFYSGCTVIQTHRVAKNYNTNIAILDSVSEEINNAIFRKGHTRFGFSSGLIGSGMAFDYPIFEKYIMKASTIGVDKQLEMFLLKNGYYIEYLSDVYTYDEKVSNSKQFYKQRKRWAATQFHNLFGGIWGCPAAALQGNWDYCNKLFQWAMPPRVILIGIITLVAIGFTLLGSYHAIKWWGLLVILCITFALAIPDYLFNKRLLKALLSVPWLFFLMLINTSTIFGRNKKFIHTEHFEE